jgi:Anti-sigma-K factor rskA
MTDRTDHAPFDELAAGYALHSLDAADESQFLQHLPACRRCQHAIGVYIEITAALLDTGSGGQPGPQLRDRILAAVSPSRRAPAVTGAVDETHPAEVSVQAVRSRRRPRRIITASAAAAVLIAGAVWGGLAAPGGSTYQPPASCAAGQCRELALTDASTGQTAARVIIQGQLVWLLPSGLTSDNTLRQVYVLWQITGAHKPLPVGSFDVSSHPVGLVRIGPLPVAYRVTWAFAVSLEQGRAIPARPSRLVALGQVS